MKSIYSIGAAMIFIIALASNASSQGNVGISNDASTPDPSAMLDVKSTTKGLLIPRMTTAERDLIGSPATGLMIYNTVDNAFNYFNGTNWIRITSLLDDLWTESGSHIYNTNSGNVGIGISIPTALLHASGTGTGGGNVLFAGEIKFTDPGDPPVEGFGTRLMWYPDKAALRAGTVSGDQWDRDNVGSFSTAFGKNTIASGDCSIASGFNSNGSGNYSTALGYFNTASENISSAIGSNCLASGNRSVALGSHNNALGIGSIAIGFFAESFSMDETVIGHWNTAYESTTGDNVGIYGKCVSPDGYGGYFLGRGYFSDNVGIGMLSPVAKLHINSTGDEMPLYIATDSEASLKVSSNRGICVGINSASTPARGIESYGNVEPFSHKTADLGADGKAWDNVYHDDLVNQGASAFEDRSPANEILYYPPFAKSPGPFDYKTERGDVEMDPDSMPPGLAEKNGLLIDEIALYNYKTNYEQPVMIEKQNAQITDQ